MNRILYTVLLLIPTIFTLGQTNTSSPYSRFGLGELQNNVFSEFNAIGGGVTGFNSSNNINPYNPASYTSFSSNSFLLSTGLRHKTVNMENNIDEQRTNNSSFSHFVMNLIYVQGLCAFVFLLQLFLKVQHFFASLFEFDVIVRKCFYVSY